MLITKTNPTGVDYHIQRFQTELHSSLMTLWGLNPGTPAENILYESYGRCYRNKKSNGYVAEVYTSDDQYKEVYWNDALMAISFFGTGDKIETSVNNLVDVHMIFFVDLKKLALKDSLNNTIAHRADEEVRKQAQVIIGKALYGFNLLSIETGLVNVLREYPGSYRDDRLKAVDMHPVHCFRLNLSLEYNINSNNC